VKGSLQRATKTSAAAGSDSAGFAVHSTRRMSEPDLAASGFTVSELCAAYSLPGRLSRLLGDGIEVLRRYNTVLPGAT
jgi:hypothetical protein